MSGSRQTRTALARRLNDHLFLVASPQYAGSAVSASRREHWFLGRGFTVHGQRSSGRHRSRLTYLAAAVVAAGVLPATLAAPAAVAQPSGHVATSGRPGTQALSHLLRIGKREVIPHAAAMRAAAARAMATGEATVVGADTTQTSQITANPNGSFTDIINALPVRVHQHGRWVPASARLIRGPHGSWQPVAATVQVRISGGGTGPLAVLSSSAGQQLSLSFPDRLPAPTINGATATYHSIRPGVDLQVTAGLYGSVTEQLIVHTHAAAVSSWLRQLTISYSAPGLRLLPDKFGDIQATDRAGNVFSIAAPVTSIPVPRVRHAMADAHPAEAAGPPQAVTTVRAGIAGRSIILPASVRQLSAADAYPATIGTTITADTPTPTATTGRAGAAIMNAAGCPSASTSCDPAQAGVGGYVEAQDVGGGSCSTDTNWNGEDPGDVHELGIGYNAWDSCIGIYQSYYMFDVTSINKSAYVLNSASLQIPVVYSALLACTESKEPIYLHSLGRGGSGGVIGPDTTGADMPVLGTSSVVYNTFPAEHSESPACAPRTAVFNVLGDMNSANNEGAQDWNYGVSGDDNIDGFGFMRLSDNPSLDVVFDETPPAPTVDQSSPAMMLNPSTQSTTFGCSTSDAVPWIGATTDNAILLQAKFNTGLSGENVMPNFAIGWSNGLAYYNTPATAQLAGDKEHGWSFTGLVDGREYTWAADTSVDANNTDNPTLTSGSTQCTFAYDATSPTTPAVQSATFPPLATSPGTTQTAPGGSGTFNFSASDPPPAGRCGTSGPVAAADSNSSDVCLASGVYEFEYSLNQPLSSNPTPLASGGKANCTSQSGAVPASNPTGNPETNANSNPSATTTGTSCAVAISQWGTNILYVAALDLAGNISQSYKYEFYVPFNQHAKTDPGDVDGDGIPDLLATNGSGNLLLYPGGTDPGVAPETASVAADAPSASNLTWDQLQIAHRGTWSGGTRDDLIVLDQTDGNLYLIKNSDTPTGMFESNQNLISFPSCGLITDPDNQNGNCAGYPSQLNGWSAFNQILVPGDAWGGATGGTSSITQDTSHASLLAVDQSTGSLWLFQGSAGALQNPVQLGASGWNDVTLLAPGDVNGQLTLWARINSGTDAGDIVSFPLAIPAGHAPTLDPSAPGTLKSPTSGTILDDTSGSPVHLTQSAYPQVAAPAPLAGGSCSTDTMACPGLYAVTSSGELVFFGGQSTTHPADALTGSSVNLDKVGTSIKQLS
jgi:hypothetical protein